MTINQDSGNKKGAEGRNENISSDRHEAAQKAAATRRERDPDAFSKMGKAGAEALNSDKEKKSEASRKAADTRKGENPDAFRQMGQKGGSQSHGGGRSNQEDE